MHWDEMTGEVHVKRPNRSGARRSTSTTSFYPAALSATGVPTVTLTSRRMIAEKRPFHRLAQHAKRQTPGSGARTPSVCKQLCFILPVQVCVSTEAEGSDGGCSEGFGNEEVFHVGRYRGKCAHRCTATRAQLQRTITACVRTLGPFSTSYHMQHTHQTAVRNTHSHIQQDGIPERIKREKMIRTKCHFCAVAASRELSNTYPQLFEYVVWMIFWSLGTECSCWSQGLTINTHTCEGTSTHRCANENASISKFHTIASVKRSHVGSAVALIFQLFLLDSSGTERKICLTHSGWRLQPQERIYNVPATEKDLRARTVSLRFLSSCISDRHFHTDTINPIRHEHLSSSSPSDGGREKGRQGHFNATR
ncbi:hypothetical protein E1301_Tti015412 [Triplophysa tibetana]|uniref:Uncharacterized protein n=1 Tax=Triplophysa tibetana TaxID=1572043 RepID=A0A5A9PNZ7_9TELE|nr:hypothetical protein E1301_Tti015412 [Triplophysa tibetana]